MELFMTNIGFSATADDIKIELAQFLHSPDYAHHVTTTTPLNLSVHIFPPRRGYRGNNLARRGVVTVPTVAIAQQLLDELGGIAPRKRVVIGTRITFQKSNRPPRPNIVEEIRRTPYEDPRARRERERAVNEVSTAIPLDAIQFGCVCRDNVYSIEWEKTCDAETTSLSYNDERREFCIEDNRRHETRIITIRASQIISSSAGRDSAGGGSPQIFFSLQSRPLLSQHSGDHPHPQAWHDGHQLLSTALEE